MASNQHENLTPKCPVHVCVPMVPEKIGYPKFVALADVDARKKQRTIFKCPVPCCIRVTSIAPTLDELEEEEIMAEGD